MIWIAGSSRWRKNLILHLFKPGGILMALHFECSTSVPDSFTDSLYLLPSETVIHPVFHSLEPLRFYSSASRESVRGPKRPFDFPVESVNGLQSRGRASWNNIWGIRFPATRVNTRRTNGYKYAYDPERLFVRLQLRVSFFHLIYLEDRMSAVYLARFLGTELEIQAIFKADKNRVTISAGNYDSFTIPYELN